MNTITNYKNVHSSSDHQKARVTSQQDACPPKDKKFFDIEYIFKDRIPAKKNKRHTYQISLNRTNKKAYKTIEGKIESESVLFHDMHLITMEPTKEKPPTYLTSKTLFFRKDNKMDSIHARKYSNRSSLNKNHSSKKPQKCNQSEMEPFKEMLTSKNYIANHQALAIEKQKRREKVERSIKRLGGGDSSRQYKTLKLQGDEFRQYCEKNIEFATNAFLHKNKQTIRIYRPWSPLQMDQGFIQSPFGQAL